MTYEEYKAAKEAIEKEADEKKNKLAIDYALKNNPYPIDSIISDTVDTIRIKKIKVTLHYGKPECVYYGIPLKKDLTPKKNDKETLIYQSNVVTEHK